MHKTDFFSFWWTSSSSKFWLVGKGEGLEIHSFDSVHTGSPAYVAFRPRRQAVRNKSDKLPGSAGLPPFRRSCSLCPIGAVPQLLTVTSPSRSRNKGNTGRGSSSQCQSPAPGPPARRSVGNCRISSTAPIEVCLFREGKGRVEGLPRKGLYLLPRRPPGGQTTAAASFFGCKLRAGTGKNPFIGWVSSSSQNFERKQLGTARKGQVGEAEVFGRLRARVSGWALAGWSPGGGRGDGPSPHHPSPSQGSHTLSSSGEY